MNKPDLIVVRGGGEPDAFATIAVANAAYAASRDNQEIELVAARTYSRYSGKGKKPEQALFVRKPTLLPYAEAQSNFRYVFGYNNRRSTQVIMQEAAKSNMVFFFGYCLVEEEMEQLLEINQNVYVFDYHDNQLSRRVADRLCMYQHTAGKCAAQFAWDFFASSHTGRYPSLVSQIATSIFGNKVAAREMYFGFTACPFLAPQWVARLGSDFQDQQDTISRRGQFFLEFHKMLQPQLLDSATIVRIEDGKAMQKQVLSKSERSSDELVIYLIQCVSPSGQYLMRCIKDLPISRRSIIVAYNYHIREKVYHYMVGTNFGQSAMDILEYRADDKECVSRNGAYLNGQGQFTSTVKPQLLLNQLVDSLPHTLGG